MGTANGIIGDRMTKFNKGGWGYSSQKTYSTIDDAYKDYKKLLIENGELIEDQRGDKVYQLSFHTLIFDKHINNIGGVYNVPIPTSSKISTEGIEQYANQLLDGNIHDFVYTYGNRLIEYFNINQYDVMVDRLHEDSNSRRAVAVTYDPKSDNDMEDIPCLMMIKLTISKNKLDMGVVFRSNDIKYAFSSNMYALFNVQLYLSKQLNIPIGKFYYVCFDPHWKLK